MRPTLLTNLPHKRTIWSGGSDVRRDNRRLTRSVRHADAEIKVCPAGTGRMGIPRQ